MKKLFLGAGLKFPFKINKEGSIDIVSCEDGISEAIKIILQTVPGERVMRPEFGCGINEYVFSVINKSNLLQIQNEVERALTLYEPRIIVENISARLEESHGSTLLINIDYIVKNTNARHNMVYPFYLREKG